VAASVKRLPVIGTNEVIEGFVTLNNNLWLYKVERSKGQLLVAATRQTAQKPITNC
jgi:hypothetical protein